MTEYNCDTCNAACQADELDEAGDCETCVDKRIARAYAYYRLQGRYDEYRAYMIASGRGHLLK